MKDASRKAFEDKFVSTTSFFVPGALGDFNPEINEQVLLEGLLDSLSGTSFRTIAIRRLAKADKWQLISNLHKAVRRGYTEIAVQSALSLLEVDADYLLRRLPVIALEDVSFGNLRICALILACAGKRRLLEKVGMQHAIALLIAELAGSPKSRTACDLLSLTEYHRDAASTTALLAGRPTGDLVRIAHDNGEPLFARLVALRLLAGYRKFERGIYRVLSSASPRELEKFCEVSETPPIISFLVLRGQNRTHHLNVALPLVYEMIKRSESVRIDLDGLPSYSTIGGVMSCAFDMYTLIGKRAFPLFAQKCKPLSEFFLSHPALNPTKVLGFTAFHVEGSVLDAKLAFAGSRDLLTEVEAAEMACHGIANHETAAEVRRLVLDNLSDLNKARKAAYASSK